MLAIFQQIGLPEIILILAVLLLLFGARKLPDLARSLGRSTKEFKTGMREGSGEDELSVEEPEAPRPSSDTEESSGRA
jgi:sec-independent protein translocase protein TatA